MCARRLAASAVLFATAEPDRNRPVVTILIRTGSSGISPGWPSLGFFGLKASSSCLYPSPALVGTSGGFWIF